MAQGRQVHHRFFRSVTTELLVGLIAVSAVFAVGRWWWPGITEPHVHLSPSVPRRQFREQPTRHLSCRIRSGVTRPKREAFGLQMPRYDGATFGLLIAPHRPERGERTTSGPAPARAGQNESKASRRFEPAAHVCQRLPTRRMRGRPTAPAPAPALFSSRSWLL